MFCKYICKYMDFLLTQKHVNGLVFNGLVLCTVFTTHCKPEQKLAYKDHVVVYFLNKKPGELKRDATEGY